MRKLQKTADSLLLNIIESAQANRLINYKLIINYQIYNFEIFSKECNIIQYYNYYKYGYVAKYYRNTKIYGRCASATYIICDCNNCEAKRYVNYIKIKIFLFNHAVWDPTCLIRINKIAKVRAVL
jgi:hypothetical protein